jgi:hypothetical protein
MGGDHDITRDWNSRGTDTSIVRGVAWTLKTWVEQPVVKKNALAAVLIATIPGVEILSNHTAALHLKL